MLPFYRLKCWLLTNYIALLMILILFGWVTSFFLYASSDIILQDQWRFLPMVKNYFEGSFSFNELWIPHNFHLIPAYKTFFLLDAIFFGLNMKLEIFIGLIALLLASIILYHRFSLSLKPHAQPVAIQLSFTLLALVLFSFNQWVYYLYTLLSSGSFTLLLLFFSICCMLDQALVNGVDKINVYSFSVLLFVTILFFAFGSGPAIIVSIILVLLIRALLAGPFDKPLFLFAALATVSSFMAITIYWNLLSGTYLHSGLTQWIGNIIINPTDSIQFVLLALSASIIDTNGLLVMGIDSDIFIAIGGLVAILYGWSCWLYWRTRMWQRTYFPILLISISWLFIGEILIGRYGQGFPLMNATAPRYAMYFQLGILGCLWIFIYTLFAKREQFKTIRLYYFLWSILIISVVALETQNALIEWGRTPLIKETLAKYRNAVEQKAFDKTVMFCPDIQLCMDGTEVLKAYKLNIFRGVVPNH